jgi:phosphate transport system permease protein
VSTLPAVEELRSGRRVRDWLGDRILFGLTLAAALAGVAAMVAIAYKVVDGARLSMAQFGLSFVWGTTWDVGKNVFGAGPLIYGTAVSSAIALVLATPLAIAIGLYLSELAPRGVRGTIGALVEMLAAIPSVVLGLWGILVLAPFVSRHVEPSLHSWFGFLPIFGEPQATGSSLFTAGLILAIMVVPIVASISHELFLSVPTELEEGALALGATRWEMVRGVILHSSRPGIAAAVILGLGRALGEAIAVTQVSGSGFGTHANLFLSGDTLAGRIAAQFQGYATKLQLSSLFYLAAILLAIGVVTNLLAQWVVRRFEFQRVGAD